MNIIAKHTTKSRLALILLTVFVSSMILKPVHILLAHHEHSQGICTSHQVGLVLTTGHFEDCPICDFEFCTFIPQEPTIVPQITVIVSTELTEPTAACLARISTFLFQLRAPPTC